jgi:hypothetical protein
MIAISDRNVLHAITSLKRTLSFALGRGLAVAATLLMLSSLTAVAGESGLWRNSGDWQIRVDSSLGHGCFMVASFRDGEIIRLGFDNNSNVSYLMMGNPKWRSLEKGMYYTVSLQFNGIPTIPWTGVVTDRGLLYFHFTNGKFWRSFAEKTMLTVFYQANVVAQLPLIGTYAAAKGVFECNRAFTVFDYSIPGDPFTR